MFKKKIFNLNILNDFLSSCLPWNLYKRTLYKKETEKWMDSNTTMDIDGPLY